jgi:hypothetical protein
MKTLSFDTQRTINALNTSKKVSICRNSKIYDLELKRAKDSGDSKIILRSRENPKTGITYKMWYTEIAKTLNNIFENSAIYEITE